MHSRMGVGSNKEREKGKGANLQNSIDKDSDLVRSRNRRGNSPFDNTFEKVIILVSSFSEGF